MINHSFYNIYSSIKDNLKKALSLICICSIINFGFITSAQAKDIMDTIIDILSGLTCTTQGVGNLLRSEFSHTCIPAPFFSFAIANILSPGFYANSVLKLKINDEQMFPNACDRNNRVDPNNLVLDFAVCSDLKLTGVRIVAIAKSVAAIASSIFTGKTPWDEIAKSWSYAKKDYHEIMHAKEGDSGVIFDLPMASLPIFPWKVMQDNDKLCVATISFMGWLPVGCKYIREPFPKSKYANFMDTEPSFNQAYQNDMATSLANCNSVNGCYQAAYQNSKTAIVITSPIIECIKQMIVKLLISRDVCSFKDLNKVVNSPARESSSFFQFQRNMYKAVTALLTIYVIFFGFKILATGDMPPKKDFINFILKIIFVIYFSIGIHIDPYNNSDYNKLDGMVQFVFPVLIEGMSQLAGWISNAAPSELCRFEASWYPSDLKHLAMWDAIDCRVSHYLGLDMIQTMFVENLSRSHDFKNFDVFNFQIPPYYYLLIPAFITGNMTLVSLALMYPLLVISLCAYLVNATVICMIGIVIIGVLAPLYVPMLLFQYTKGYFDGWVKLLISFLLQPMVVTVFITVMFSVYDFGFYGSCKYKSASLDSSGRNTKLFFIDNNWDSNIYGPGEADGCKRSLGYMLNNPLAAAYDLTKSSVDAMFGSPNPNTNTDNYMSKFPFLSGTKSPGVFLASPTLLLERVKEIVLALITACFTLYLMYHLSSQLSNFAADMTEGVSLNDVTIGPQAIFKAGMKALSAAGGGIPGGGIGKKAMGKANDIFGTGGSRGGASDKFSLGSGEGADDKFSTGDGSKALADDFINTTVSNNKNVETRNSLDTKLKGDNKNTANSNNKSIEVGSGFDTTLKVDKQTNTAVSDNKNVEVRSNSDSTLNTEISKNNQETIKDNIEKTEIKNSEVIKSNNQETLTEATKSNLKVQPKLNISNVRKNIEQFFASKDLDANNIRGLSNWDFAKYVAFADNEKDFTNVKDKYEKTLKETMQNVQVAGKEGFKEDFAKHIESMFEGDRKEVIKQINSKVIDEINNEENNKRTKKK